MINLSILKKVIFYGVFSSLLSILLTMSIDTYFWRERFNQVLRKEPSETFFIWPELQMLYYNTVLNKSHEWGVSPWHWYFLNAIPKSVTCSLFFIGPGLFYQRRGGFLDWRIAEVIGPALIFVGLYSFLPHKELRFIFPALTLINIGAAIGLAKM